MTWIQRFLSGLGRVDAGAATEARAALPGTVSASPAALDRTSAYWRDRAIKAEGGGIRGPAREQFDTSPDLRPILRTDTRRDSTGEPVSVPLRVYTNPGGTLITARAAADVRSYASTGYAEVTDPDMTTPVGNYGTPYAGQIPWIEQRQELTPTWKARGFSNDQGEFNRYYRGDPEIGNAVDRRVDYLVGASWEFEAPDFDDRVYALAGTTRDQVQRDADALNAEFLLSRSVATSQIIAELVRTTFISGFSGHEFWFDPDAPVGYRTSIEHRSPQSIQGQVLTPRGDLGGITQVMVSGTIMGTGSRDFPVISARKLIWATHRKVGANHEGISGLRQSWWYNALATVLLKCADTHWKRFGPGFPVIRKTKEDTFGSQLVGTLKDYLGKFFYSPDAWLEIPANVELEMLQMRPESANLTELLNWLEERKRRSVGADFFAIGTRSGSYALSDIVSQMMLKALQGEAIEYAAAFSTYAEEYLRMYEGERSVLPMMTVRGIMHRSDTETLKVYTEFADLAGKERPGGRPVFTMAELKSLREQLDVVQIEDDESLLTLSADQPAPADVPSTQAPAAPAPVPTPDTGGGMITEPLAVGTVQASVEILAALGSTIAPEAGEALLVAAGVPSDQAQTMVAAQTAFRQTHPAPNV